MAIKRENVYVLIASLVISLGVRLALSPSLSATKEILFDAKLEFQNLPDSLMVVGARQTIPMRATGTAQYLDQLDRGSVTAVVDLSLARPGSRMYLVDVKAPSRSRVSISPRNSKIPLDVQKVSSIVEKVTVEPSGQTPHDYVFDGATTLPEKVLITGADSFLPRVKTARVSLDLGQVRPGMTFMLPIEILDADNRVIPYVYAQPTEVSVSPAVAAAPTQKRVLVDPTWIGQPAFGYSVVSYEVRPSQIEIRGDSATISRVAAVDTESISIAGLRSDSTFRVKVRLPVGMKSIDANEVTVIVKVAKRPGTEMRSP